MSADLEALARRLTPIIDRALPMDVGEVLGRLDLDSRVPICSTNLPPAEAELVDEMRRFYERPGAPS
jgi:hypothetical protein